MKKIKVDSAVMIYAILVLIILTSLIGFFYVRRELNDIKMQLQIIKVSANYLF